MRPQGDESDQLDQPGNTVEEGGEDLISPTTELHPRYGSGSNWLMNRQGELHPGWVIVIFLMLYRIFFLVFGTFALAFYPDLAKAGYNAPTALISELVPFFAMLAAAALVSSVEHRRIADYNLRGERKLAHFFSGWVAGFVALTVLVLGLAGGGWLKFGSVALHGASIVQFGALWGLTFLIVGSFEEGVFRCFLLSVLTRGLNFWWALGIVATVCADLVMRSHGITGIASLIWLSPKSELAGNGMWGVFAVALLGLVPCFVLHKRDGRKYRFWQAAWATSTVFGFIHTGNNGENWIGIFAAAAIGFVFCVSVWATGSAWWAIGCHAAWDWAETYFYGTADSGLPAQGHLLSTSPVGNVMWSGGTDGPEGSLLVLGVIVLLLVAVLAIYGRRADEVVSLTPSES